MKKWLYFWISVVDLLLLIWIGNHRFGVVPPLGKFLSPTEGFWQNAEIENSWLKKDGSLPALKDRVYVLYDDRQVPHIHSQNTHDIYYTFGYITAKNRLWQMETQARAAAGRLAEVLGEKALGHDLFYRQAGLLESCRQSLKILSSHAETREILKAYTQGVNDYIQSLRPRDYPLEYKILGYSPEEWSPLKSILLLKLMAWRLSGRHLQKEIAMAGLFPKLSYEDWKSLFVEREETEPVIPPEKIWTFDALQGKGPRRPYKPLSLEYSPAFEDSLSGRGSNNWAASGKKTKTGTPLLASDPHLQLTLPSIWYEAQLWGPNANVYGVSIPGAPVILIGFNSHIAWAVTNSEADVADLYEVQFKDKSRGEYRYDGGWRKTRIVLEKIKIRGRKTLELPVVYTHHGPVIFLGKSQNTGLALRWSGHAVSNELRTFLELNRAKNYSDYEKALKHYNCPAQNFAFASRQGDIAIWHSGRIPLKWPGQGLAISSGEDPLFEWKGFIPHDQLPHIKNPQRGFVSSANQYPVDYSSYPYFIGGFVFEEYRNKRINEVLRKKTALTPGDFQRLQLDTKNLQGASLVPSLLKMLSQKDLSPLEKEVFKILEKWNFFQPAKEVAPTVFEEWWKRLYRSIWEDELGKGPYPSWEKSIVLFLKNSKWVDDQKTSKRESPSDLALRSFRETCKTLEKKYGPPGNQWAWGHHKTLHIDHMARLRNFGRGLFIGGGGRTLNAITRRTGPSWRMVVSLEKEVKAWGVYPGGQSGNPGSPYYDKFVDDWAQGKYHELLYLNRGFDSDKKHPRIKKVWIPRVAGRKKP